MAEASSLKAYVNDVTKCPICLEDFDKPRILPCVHTFCLKCLIGHCGNKSPRDGVECPVCRRQFQIPNAGVDQLEHNFFVEGLVSAKSVSRAKDSSCEGCEKMRASVFCLSCRQKLCDDCDRLHRKWKSGPHEIAPLGEEVQSELLKLRGSYCEEHESEEVKMYCSVCSEIICMMCFALKHQKHQCQEVSKVAKEFDRQIRADVQGVFEKIRYTRDEFEGLKTDRKDFKTKVGKIENEIKENGEKVKKLVDQQVGQLLQEMQENKRYVEKNFASCQDEMELGLVAMESFNNYSQEVVSKGNFCDVARAAKHLQSRAVELQQKKIDRYYAPEYTFQPTDFQTRSTRGMASLAGRINATQKTAGPQGQTARHLREKLRQEGKSMNRFEKKINCDYQGYD